MYDFLRHLPAHRGTLHRVFALVFTSGVAGLIGFGAFAIGSAIAASTAVGITFGSLTALVLFSPMLSILTMPDEGVGTIGEQAPPLQQVFSGLF